jgi:hypothetical protein
MNDTGRLFQALVAPAIFVSATALFVLSINVRLMGMVSRLRQSVCAHFAGCFDHVVCYSASGCTGAKLHL